MDLNYKESFDSFLWLSKILNVFHEQLLDEIIISDRKYFIACSKNKVSMKKHDFFYDLNNEDIIKEYQLFSLYMNQYLEPSHPFSGGTLRSSSYRWQCVIPPVVDSFPVFAIRKHRFSSLTLGSFNVSKEFYKLLEKIEHPSIIISGPTSSGKTSFLSSFLKEFFFNKRVLILEDYKELLISSPFWFRMTPFISSGSEKKSIFLEDLFAQSLRLRPDCIVFGEIRNHHIELFVNSLLSGVESTIATIHAGSISNLQQRMKFLLKDKGMLDEFKKSMKSVLGVVLKRASPPVLDEFKILDF